MIDNLPPMPYDRATLAQRSRILTELYRLNPTLPYEGGENEWLSELEKQSGVKVTSIDNLEKKVASQIIDTLIRKE
jgi:hypothetical protein